MKNSICKIIINQGLEQSVAILVYRNLNKSYIFQEK